MNSIPHLLPSLPFSYQDGSFQVLLRNPESVAVFWDLPEESATDKTGETPDHTDRRLCIHITSIQTGEAVSGKQAEVLILHHEAGHAFVPLTPGCDRYRFTLGWQDGRDFHQLAVDEVEMPSAGGEKRQPEMKEAVEGRGFHPLAMALR